MKSINKRTGIIPAFHLLKTEHGDPRNITIFGSTVGEPVELGGLGEVLTVGGIGFSEKSALLACFGEAFERYSSAFCIDYVMDTEENLGNCVTGWPLYSKQLYENWPHMVPYSKDKPISWTKVINYQTGKVKNAPAPLVYHPWLTQPGGTNIFASSTNGLASHKSGVDAIRMGSFEILERDSFALAWLSGQPLPIVDVEWTKKFASDFGVSSTWRVILVDLTCDTKVPIYLASIMAPTSMGQIFGIGAAARFNPIDAAKKALLEAIQTVIYVRYLKRIEPNWRPSENFLNISTFKDHARFYSCAPHDYHVGFQYIHPFDDQIKLHAKPPDQAETPFTNINDLMDHLQSIEIDMYVKRLTTRDVYQIGHEVARVLSPQLMPLHGHYQLAALQCPRLWNLENVFPFTIKSPNSPKEVYKWPHPFA